jgi:FkbM family methyltransferase
MGQLPAKILKLLKILSRAGLWRYAYHGIAPTIEHIPAIKGLQIGSCIDVGANIGQFSALVSYLHPSATIFAFEPLPEASRKFRSGLSGPRIFHINCGIGKNSGSTTLHVTSRADSSSFLVPAQNQERAFGVVESDSIKVPVQRLDEALRSVSLPPPVLLKIDVQGFELDVLEGAGALIASIDYCYLELSYVELYEGQPLASSVLSYLFSRGFQLAGVFNQVDTRAFGPTQADFLLANNLGSKAQSVFSRNRNGPRRPV